MHVFDLIVGALALIGLLVVISLAWSAVAALAKRDREVEPEAPWDDDDLPENAVERTHAYAEALEESREWMMMTPDALELDPRFVAAVEGLAGEETPVSEVVDLARHPDGWTASIALAALARRDDVPDGWAEAGFRGLPRYSNCEDAFQLRALARHAPAPAIGRILARTDGINPEYVVEFVRSRIADGETVDAATFHGHVTIGQADALAGYLDRWGPDMGDDVREAFEEWRALELLGGVGRVWKRPYDVPPALLVGRRSEIVEHALAALNETPRRSVLLVGEHGTGKTAVARAALDRLDGAVVFEATASQVLAGAMYIGELEGRVKDLAGAMRGRDMIWVLPELQEALFAGQHPQPARAAGRAAAEHRVRRDHGRRRGHADRTRGAADVPAAGDERIRRDPVEGSRPSPSRIEVARHALEHDSLGVTTDDDTLVRTYDLAQQFLPGVSPPGNMLRLVRAAALDAEDAGRERFDSSDVLATLASASGLPLALLDASVRLRLEDVRAFFEARILEQPEPSTVSSTAIAMIKAGLTDPTRPLGVFLFLGPTGTGKTEIAKAFAEFLFGSPDRIVRLDMSEFQTPESLERLLADTTLDGHGAGLVSAVRKRPFSWSCSTSSRRPRGRSGTSSCRSSTTAASPTRTGASSTSAAA